MRSKFARLCVLMGLLGSVVGCAPVPDAPDLPAVPTAVLVTPDTGEEPADITVEEPPEPTKTSIPTTDPEEAFVYHACEPAVRVLEGHFLLGLPIGPQDNQEIDRTYRYGSTANGQYEPHHGVEFPNPAGTPVLAAAGGLVIEAGTDREQAYGPYLDFYGNLVILKHDLPGIGEPVYTLYAHLSAVEVVVGQEVTAGQVIGKVGATGWAIGSHLHFEVRVGENEYRATRNPELWLAQRGGALAGYVLGTGGRVLQIEAVLVRHQPAEGLPGQRSIYLEPYQGESVNPDQDWGERFAVGGLLPGHYLTAFTYGKPYELEVEVQADSLTLIAVCITD